MKKQRTALALALVRLRIRKQRAGRSRTHAIMREWTLNRGRTKRTDGYLVRTIGLNGHLQKLDVFVYSTWSKVRCECVKGALFVMYGGRTMRCSRR